MMEKMNDDMMEKMNDNMMEKMNDDMMEIMNDKLNILTPFMDKFPNVQYFEGYKSTF